MAANAQATGWDRPEVNLRLTRRRKELLRSLLAASGMEGMSPTEALDRALEAAAYGAGRDDEAPALLEAFEHSAAEQRIKLARLEAAVVDLADRVESLCALIADVAQSEQ